MSVDFTIKRGDTIPTLTASLKDETGAAVDLTGAAVVLNARSSQGVVRTRACVIAAPATSGVVSYTFVAGDWASDFLAGRYQLEFEVTFAGGAKLTVPTDGYKLMVVVADLA